jgi:ABC-type phosphate/phosphonate transport system substrate-binding protein
VIDPDTLIFAYTPVEDPAVYKEAWSDFLTHLDKVTGKKSVFFPVQSNAAQIEAMRSGRLHIAGFNTGSNPLAVNCAGFRPFTIMASKTAASATRWKSSPIRVRASKKSRTSRARPGLHLRDLELGLQGAVGDPEGRIRHGRRHRFRAGLFGQA